MAGAHLAKAELDRAQLQGVDLTGANMEKTDLRGADLRDAQGLEQSQLLVATRGPTTDAPVVQTLLPDAFSDLSNALP